MLTFFFVLSVIASFGCFILMIADISNLTIFIGVLIGTIFLGVLSTLEKKLEQAEQDIKYIQNHLNIETPKITKDDIAKTKE